MTDIAIRCEGLGKQYRIGERERYKALRDTIADAVSAPFRRLKTLRNPRPATRDSEFWALKDVSFEIRRGEVVGIIGRNGAGKSTLLKILSRITAPTTGEVKIHGRVGSLLEVGTGFHPELTGRENIFLNGAILGMKRAEIERKFDEIVAFAEIETFLDTPVKRYSSGMYVRLAFAVAAHLEPEILIVDEVLAVGDAAFQKKCLGKMDEVSKEGRTVLFVSHNMSAISDLCSSAIVLDKGGIVKQGNLQETVELYLNQGISNEVVFPKGALTAAAVKQKGSQIVIEAEYRCERYISFPCLGFVISDTLGNPICGSNPILDRITLPNIPKKVGRVRVNLDSPKLLNGTYRLSLWFGDGKEDFFSAKDCLAFEVINMVSTRHLPASLVGSVSPKCIWYFEEL